MKKAVALIILGTCLSAFAQTPRLELLPERPVRIHPLLVRVEKGSWARVSTRIQVYDTTGKLSLIYLGNDTPPKTACGFFSDGYRFSKAYSNHAKKVIEQAKMLCRFVIINSALCGINQFGVASESLPECTPTDP